MACIACYNCLLACGNKNDAFCTIHAAHKNGQFFKILIFRFLEDLLTNQQICTKANLLHHMDNRDKNYKNYRKKFTDQIYP